MNFLSGRIAAVHDTGAHVALEAAPNIPSDATLPLRGASVTAQQPIRLGIRPEHVTLGASVPGSLNLTATIDRIEQLGAASFLYCSLGSGERLTVHTAGQVRYSSGDQVTVNLPITDTHLFDISDAETALALR
jgi:ABC-type sugar transport system ATPase subunit